MIYQIRNALSIFNKKEKLYLAGIFILMFVTLFSEAAGISLIYPFLAVVTKPELIGSNEFLSFLFNSLGFQSNLYFITFMGIGIFIVFILKNLFYFLSQFVQLNYLIKRRVEMTARLFRGYMESEYEQHLNTNPAILIRNINSVDSIFAGFLQPIFGIISEVFILCGICVVLMYNNWQIMIGSLFILVLPVWIGNKLIAGHLRRIGKENFEFIAITTKILLEGLHGIKEILVMKKASFFASNFFFFGMKLGYLRRNMRLINYTPKIITETVLVGSVTLLVLIVLYSGKAFYDFIPILGLYAVGAHRMVGSLNKVASGIQTLKYNQVLTETVIDELCLFGKNPIDDDLSRHENLSGNKELYRFSEISLKRVTFYYKSSKTKILNNLSLSIVRGQSVGIVGPSGAGKSTLMDILLGLLRPSEGDFLIDNIEYGKMTREWASLIGYIPQSIYLRDDNLRNNIAFGINEENIDDKALEKAIKISQLEEVIRDLPEGIDTTIGERGVRLSGGQRQRIAIARALYHDPQIILMDEATSALDNQTEAEFMKSIELLQGVKTMVIIAHRLSTVKNCDVIYFMKDGLIESKGTFEELLKESESFRLMANADMV
jgi:ATP-binding cassette, subfamily B, bacterial PglK